MFDAVLLAAGYGNRISNLTMGKPKALLSFGRGTILDHIINHLKNLKDLNDIILITNETHKSFFEKWLEKSNYAKIKLISNGVNNSKKPRGAISDALFAIETCNLSKKDLLIAGTDWVSLEKNLSELSYKFIKEKNSFVALYDYKKRELVKKLACAILNKDNLITELEEKPENPQTTLGVPPIFFIKSVDIYLLKELADKGIDSIGYYLEELSKKRRLSGYILENPILDIGTPEDYAKAKILIDEY